MAYIVTSPKIDKHKINIKPLGKLYSLLTNFSGSICLAPFSMYACSNRTRGGIFPGLSHNKGVSRNGNSSMYVAGIVVLCNSMSRDKI